MIDAMLNSGFGYLPIAIIVLYAYIQYVKSKIKSKGLVYVIVSHFKWITGILIMFMSLYIIFELMDYVSSNGWSVWLVTPFGLAIILIPMHYTNKVCFILEDRMKKVSEASDNESK